MAGEFRNIQLGKERTGSVAGFPLVHVRPGRIPAIMLGRSQRELWTEPKLPVRVRTSGGGAVLSGPWLLRAAVVLPRTHVVAQHGPAAAARWYGDVHRRWLRDQGLGAAALYHGATVEHWACFAGRGPGEVVIGDRKIVGIAQAWRKQAVLLSAGMLVSLPPWALLCATLRRPPDEAVALAALSISAHECLGHPIDARAWAGSLCNALRLALAQAIASPDCNAPAVEPGRPGRAAAP